MSKAATHPGARPRATLSLDLDNLWCYQRSFGLEDWRSYPSFLDLALPRVLDFLDAAGLKVTFFIVGRDAADPANHALLSQIAARGHEVGNHSFDHELSLHGKPQGEIRDEIERAAGAIEDATGQKPRGFRGPAFGLSATMLDALAALGYDYDASTCPNSLGLAARLWHRRKASRIGRDENVTGRLYGNLAEARQSLRPYRWSLEENDLMEMPVTTLPFLRLPFHGTYLNYLADFSPALARRYFAMALWACKFCSVPPSFLLHASDFLGRDDPVALSYLPGMKRTAAEKNEFMRQVLETYSQTFDISPIGAFVDDLKRDQSLPRLVPAFGV